MKSSLIVDTQNIAGKALQKTITYINPEATNADLKTFAQKLTAISTDSYIDASRVNKINVDDSDSGGGSAKQEPTLEVDSSGTVTYDGDGTLFLNMDNYAFGRIKDNTIEAKNDNGWLDSFSGTIFASEGNSFAAKSVPFSK